ncbi:MAG TPA: hypothetical protein VF801_06390 [Rhodocyclaceae bacterium]
MPRNSANTETVSHKKNTLPGRAAAISARMLAPHSTAPSGLVARAPKSPCWMNAGSRSRWRTPNQLATATAMTGVQNTVRTQKGTYSLGISRSPRVQCASTAARISRGNAMSVKIESHIATRLAELSRASLLKTPGNDISHASAAQACSQ